MIFLSSMIGLIICPPNLLDIFINAIAHILGLPDLGEEVPKDKRISWEHATKQLGTQVSNISTSRIWIIGITDEHRHWVGSFPLHPSYCELKKHVCIYIDEINAFESGTSRQV